MEICGVIAASVTHASELAIGSIEWETETLAASEPCGGAGATADAARSALPRRMRLVFFWAVSYFALFYWDSAAGSKVGDGG